MINIDDFVREKLNEHPQKDDSAAAWLKMKELLDKEKPEKVAPFFFRWRKPMALGAAAILLSALCVGGYELNKLRQAENIDAPISINNTNNHSSKNNIANHNDSNPTSNQALIKDAENAQQSTPNKHNNNTYQTNSASNADNRKSKIQNNIINSTSENQNTSTASGYTSQQLGKKNNDVTTNTNQTTFAANAHTGSENSNTKNNTGIDHKNNRKNGVNRTQSDNLNQLNSKSAITTVQKTVAQNSKNEFAVNSTTVGAKNELKAESDKLKENNTSLAGNTKNNNEGNAVANSKDSIPTTTIITKEKSSKGFPRKTISHSDTIASGKVALPNTQSNNPNSIVKNTQTSESNQSTAQAQNKKTNTTREKRKDEFAGKTPNAATKQQNNVEQKNTVTLAKKEKSKAAKWFDNLNLPQAAADAKRDLKNAKFYAGFSAGANYSISNNNNFQGVQFGPTGELVFNKHWSLFGAIKYFNRSGGKKTVNDSYAKEIANDTPSISGANWYYKVHTDSTNRFFNFSTLHSFELPITIRYAFNKFYVMTGINLAYYLGVNVEEVQKNYSPVNLHFVQTNSTKPILNESKPTLSATDFGSKFGMGYILGAGYQMSPSWQADIQVVNNFWDNSKGKGAQKLSKDFYKLPSLQITIGYQFNRGKSKPTFGPTDNH